MTDFAIPPLKASRAAFVCLAAVACLSADPLTRSYQIDFGRDVASRDLKGLATRSDGRIVPGPVLTDLAGPAIGQLLWTLESAGENRWLVGTGPEGKIMEVALDGGSYTTREIADLNEPQVLALRRMPDGSLLAGTSPTGALYLLKDGSPIARVVLPVDSVFDCLLLPDDDPKPSTPSAKPSPAALVATGNPGRIYRVDLAKFAAAGIAPEKTAGPENLADKGITLFGEIRDRNVRRIARLADGRIAAGSAPRGNVYVFPAAGGPGAAGSAKTAAPVILQENRNAEVTDLLPQPGGDLYATIIYSSGPAETRINRPTPSLATTTTSAETRSAEGPPPELPWPEPPHFIGRSVVAFFPANGFPETLLSRSGLAFYRLARRGDLLLIAAGEQGDLLAWDIEERVSLTFAGSIAAQLNGLAALPGSTDRFLLLRNNSPGLALLDFVGAGPRELETRRLDLGVPAELGKLRFAALRNLSIESLRLEAKTSLGSDETEGWTEWTRLGAGDGAYLDARLRGRFVKFRLTTPVDARDFEIGRATLYHLPQNRRPLLTDFRILPPNLAINPAPEPAPPAAATLGQILNPNAPPPSGGSDGASGDVKRKNALFGSPIVPRPGSQIVYWSVIDPDGDNFACTLSIKPASADAWIDVARGIRDPYAQFDLGSFADGLYLTRLVAEEQAPRPAADRLSATFATDDLLIDRTPPEILDATVRRQNGGAIVTVRGRDALSLLDGVNLVFNNGWRETVDHPADGILDGREEIFETSVSADKVAGATAVEAQLSDQMGNIATRRLDLGS